jgi:uncharacterized delta-60 repeat protein
MKKNTAKLIPLLTAGIVPATAITSGLISAPAAAAPGDLDPGFGDIGRLGPILNGPAWSLELQADGSMLLAGGRYIPGYCGGWYCYYTYTSNFVSQFSDTGLMDAGFTAASVQDTQVFDVARQPDGLIVAAGRTIGVGTSFLAVFRLQSDGSLDQAFANAGMFQLSSVNYGEQHAGTSMVLDPDGKIVVAGSRNDRLIVVRLLPNGSLDGSFGTAGVVTGPEALDFSGDSSAGARTNILRTAGGGYRVIASDMAGCHIVALTAAGVMDNAFGTAGIATVDGASGPSSFCNSMVAQADGSLVVAGKANGQGFAARILADGQPDPSFDASAVSSVLSEATAVAVSPDDSVVVAGASVSGETIVRLQSTGELDALFGNAGTTLIDLPSVYGVATVVHDMQVAADGSVLATGGANSDAFLVRLLSAGGGDSPGVLGVTERSVIPTVDGSDEVVVKVRRTGGAAGTVSVAYQTVVDGAHNSGATGGQDYTPVSGRLTWADGDTAEQQIQVQILSGGAVDPYEYFEMELSDVQGGAGLGVRNAIVQIAADGAPFGQLGFTADAYGAREFGSATVDVARDFYSSGSVSVTVTPIAGTATAGSDFIANPVTLTWSDGESGWKSAAFAIVDDAEDEPSESFTIELSNATGGALLGPRSTAVVTIARSDAPGSGPRPKSKGGGAVGLFSLLLLGLMSFFRPFCPLLYRQARPVPTTICSRTGPTLRASTSIRATQADGAILWKLAAYFRR